MSMTMTMMMIMMTMMMMMMMMMMIMIMMMIMMMMMMMTLYKAHMQRKETAVWVHPPSISQPINKKQWSPRKEGRYPEGSWLTSLVL